MEPWAWAIFVTITIALIGAVWLLFRAKVERTEARLDDHVKDDIKAHERLTAVETEVANIKQEVRALRDMRHEIIEHCTQALASWYQRVVEMIAKLK